MTGLKGAIRRLVATLAPTVALGLGVISGLAGCGLLDVSDPTAIEERELNDAAGAELLRVGVLTTFANAVDDGAYASGLLADEFLYDLPSFAPPGTEPQDLLDRRESVQYEALGGDPSGYGLWQEARRAASLAMPKLQTYLPAGVADAKVGEMLALRGYATLRLAEDFCPGFPLHDVVDLKPVFSSPFSTEAAFTKALADFDSAVSMAADSARVLHLAQVGRARTLLGLGRFDEAGMAVAGLPTDYVANAEYSESIGLWNLSLAFGHFGDLSQSVANQEGGTGLDFVAAGDPRVQLDTLGVATDGVTGIYRSAKYPNLDAPIVLASGIEARLIEAEAALHAGGDWLGILNALRGSAGLPPLADPGTEAAQVDLLFRERAFWLFATGHRLADLRRLVRIYGRTAESVFPTGAYRLGGTYGTATSIPFPAALETPFNPAVTGCTSR